MLKTPSLLAYRSFLFYLILTASFACHSDTSDGPVAVGTSKLDSLKAKTLLQSFRELSTTDELALNLLDQLQSSSDTLNRLYSTFPGIYQPD